MRFNPDLSELIPTAHLDADFGGAFEYEFEPESYWSQIVSYVHRLSAFHVYVSYRSSMSDIVKLLPTALG